jgi:uroporphyrinogen decarboxylase
MRQAGRYLPEYRELRAQAKNFLNMCLTPDYAVEITLQPIRRFDLDAAIIFADILLVPLALGQKLEFREGEGPILEPLVGEHAVHELNYNASKILPVFATLRGVKPQLPKHTTLIGFCGAPWTVAAYMIDGNSKHDFYRAKSWVREQPHLLEKLIHKLVEASYEYLSAQINAGAEVLQIFDSWSGLLEGDDFNRWVIEPTRELVARLKLKYPNTPIIGFPREAGQSYHNYARMTGVDGLSLDQHVNLDFAKRDLQPAVVLQGNLDPALLVRGGGAMKDALLNIMDKMGKRHIINLGHGVTPDTPPEHVAELVRIVRRQ